MTDRFRALVLEETDGRQTARIAEIAESDLPAGNVDVAIDYSDLNWKDGLILTGQGRLVRRFPHVPGIDFAGTVSRSDDPAFAPGDKVILTGWRVGETWWGGFAQRARVKGEWLVPMPAGLDSRRAMAIGTAGLTAALALAALERNGLRPEQEGELLVTGAAGGLGSIAVALAAKSGYRVVASSGRTEAHDYLRRLGAAEIVDRGMLAEGPAKPLESERWAGAIDSVGSTTLARILAQMRYRAAVAACGLAGGNDLPASVVPFLLRGVRLIGIDSVLCPMEERRAAWQRLAAELPMDLLDEMTEIVPLAALPELAPRILAGQIRGRTVVDVNA